MKYEVASEDSAFGHEIDRRLAELDGPALSVLRRLSSPPGLIMSGFVIALILTLVAVPNGLFDPAVRTVTVTLGLIAVWRYGWWMTHAVRCERFSKAVYPRMREKADLVWQRGWRPRKVHFMLTTYLEKPEISRRVIDAIVSEVRQTGLSAHIWIGTGDSFDEKVITEHVRKTLMDVDAELTFVRQSEPGKRMAIGTVLRAIARSGAGPRDLVVFMDGDAVLGDGSLEKCASLFGADWELEALTTDEEVVCFGPRWMESWLRMRFAQRRIAMQSHALSGKVLTLTGRMSVFRGNHVLDPAFIRTIETDFLDHWLWGRFRFLSGDDKSTWYYLLSKSAKMTYVPDAMVYTIEVVEGSGWKRMVANLRRWSGNMLRNGSRAIALGPRVTGNFVWWCVVDQKLAMWTTLISPTLALYGSIMVPAFALTAVLWVLVTRTLLTLFLFRWSRHVDPSWPFLLYFNQVVNAAVKVLITSRIAEQRWANRGNQKSGASTGWRRRLQFSIANFQLVTTLTAFFWFMAIWSGFAEVPL